MTDDTDRDCDWVLAARGGYALPGRYSKLTRPLHPDLKVFPCVLPLGHDDDHEWAEKPLMTEEVS